MGVLSRLIVPSVSSIALLLVFAFFRRVAPRDVDGEDATDGRRLPYGVAGAIMWTLGIAIAIGGFFVLRGANQIWAHRDEGRDMTVLPAAITWWFLPGFSSMLIPWLVTLALLRATGYSGQAAEIVRRGNKKLNVNGERVMHLLALFTFVPLAVATLLAIPMHLSVAGDLVRLTRYGHVSPEVFRLSEARHAYWVEGYFLRDGTFQSHPDLVMEFADGRRLSANAMGDASTVPSPQLIDRLMQGTGLKLQTIHTEQDISHR